MKILNAKKVLSSSLLGMLFLAGLGTVNVAYANAVDEAADACNEAARLLTEDDDLDAAIEEATWCLTSLNQLKEEIQLSLMPDELDGFVGSEIKSENVMGMQSISREYTQDGDSLTVTLVTQSAAGGGGAEGFGELGKMLGALGMAGATAGGDGKKVRIQRRTAIASDDDDGTGSLNIELKSGSSLQVESDVFDSDELIEFMEQFPVAEIDDATGN